MRKGDHAYAKARQLRRDMSLPERLLWRELRGKPAGLKFRRQHPIGPYVIDFYCAAAKLGIEVDGIGHDMGERPERDLRRDAFLREHGVDVVRLPAQDVLNAPGEAAETVLALCRARCMTPPSAASGVCHLPIASQRGG